MRLFIGLFLAAALTCEPAFCAAAKTADGEKPPLSVRDNPRSRGKGLKLTGVLSASIGGGTGALAFLVGLLWQTCLGAEGEKEARCKRNAHDLQVAGAGLAGVGLLVGIPLIHFGDSQEEDWRQWNTDHDIRVDDAPRERRRTVSYRTTVLDVSF